MSKLVKVRAMVSMSIALASCGDNCSSELLATSQAPNGRAQAAFLKTNCGATTGFRYDVRVSNDGDAAGTGKTVLRFDSNNSRIWPDDDREVLSMSWIKNDRLLITSNLPIRIFVEENKANRISVTFSFSAEVVRL